MADQNKSVMIGIFVIAAFAIVIFMVLFLHPSLGDEGRLIRVRFADIDKISLGTRVTFAGKPIGEVIKIEEIEGTDETRMEHNGIIYVYELTLAIDTGVVVFTTDEITSRTSGLLGEKSVSIMPLPAKPGHELVPVVNQILYSTETGSVESTLKEFKELSDKIEITLDGFIDAFETLRGSKTWENAGRLVQNFSDISVALNRPEKLVASVDDLASTLQNTKNVTADVLEGKGSLGRLLVKDDIYNDLLSMSQTGRTLFTNIQNGEGTIGKIFVNDDLYLRMASLFSKGEVILNDINHYGILFHLDKGWKRLRARRLNILQQLCSPQQFRNYFNDEIDGITTSLERVSMVLQKSDEVCPCGYLTQNPEYVKVYAELLRRVATLEEYLEMYNQQVVDCEVRTVEFEE